MKTITETFNVYDIDELKEVDKASYNEAIEKTRDEFCDYITSFYYDDMRNTIKKIADFLNVTIDDYGYGVYNYRNFVDINKETYLDLDNTSKKEIVRKVNDIISKPKEFDCEFTGVYTDGYFIRYFEDNNIKKVTFNNLHKNFEDLFHFMVSKFCEDLENEIEDDDLISEYAVDNYYLYKENGEFYNGNIA